MRLHTLTWWWLGIGAVTMLAAPILGVAFWVEAALYERWKRRRRPAPERPDDLAQPERPQAAYSNRR